MYDTNAGEAVIKFASRAESDELIAALQIEEAHAHLDDETIEETARRLLESGGVSMLPYGQALERKENYLALLRKLEFEVKSGELVELALAEGVIFEGARSHRDAWPNWPARVGALIAADLGLEADKVTET